MKGIVTIFFLASLFGGCATREPTDSTYFSILTGSLPQANLTLNIPGLGPCTDNPDRSLHLDAKQPVNVLVHGCFGSSGQFRGLAQVMAFHGQQTACFTYDDRAGLLHSSTDLRLAVDQLADKTSAAQITVIGHSQGALIARKALTELATPSVRPTDLRLVTISGPFDGIASAETCGKTWLYPLTLGLLPASCYLVTGAKWADITYTSRFIREPGTLSPQVGSYLKIDTDERNTCRRAEGGRCLEDDDIFSLAEQRNALLDNDPRTKRVEIRAGHVEIVGDKRVAPAKLITILQQQGILRATDSAQISEFRQLLARIYQDTSYLENNVISTDLER